jgi:SPP1 family predicted phage head-tail adaptor
LQKQGERIDDGTGGGSIPFEDVVKVHASIEPLSGNELLRAEQFEASLTHRVRTRYYPGVKPHWRIRYDDDRADITRVFDIKSVIDPEERHRELELMCEELVSW